ncbi:MFS transporter [Streptomyces sp. NPDC005438]|uniref:MFS transporter n=1 Tax=Streptomyces sp. NPDC005438 TaxID=3156880 RepID=UPI0033AFA4BD
MPRHRVWPLYVGGFLGPYGSTMVTPMVHEVAEGLRSTPETAATAVTVYMLPFAALMLLSGTLAERWGRGRVLQLALAGFVVATALCALAPSMRFFLAARVLQGATNAFTTPLMVAAISDLVPSRRLGRALGWFAAAQAAGQGVSPVITGASAAAHWRLAFLVPGLCALVLCALPPSREATRRTAESRASWRELANRRLALGCAVAFLCYLAAVGLTVLAVLRGHDRFGLGPLELGLLSAVFGCAGIAGASLVGPGMARWGVAPFGLVANLALLGGLLAAALGPSLWVMAPGIALVGLAVTGLRSVTNTLAVTSAPGNRAGAASLAMSAQFFGGACAPPLWMATYDRWGDWGFAATALAPLVALAVLTSVTRRASRTSRASAPGPGAPASDGVRPTSPSAPT